MRWELGGSLSMVGEDEIGLFGQIQTEVSNEEVLNLCKCCAFALHVIRD